MNSNEPRHVYSGMRYLVIAVCVAACGQGTDVPVVPMAQEPCSTLEAAPFDGSAETEARSCAFDLPASPIVHARVRNRPGNDARDVTQLLIYVSAADGTALGTSAAFTVNAGEQLDAWQELEATVDLSAHPGAARAVLEVSPFHVPGAQQLVDVEGFKLTAGP